MADRLIYVGGISELEQIATQYRGRLVPQCDYVFGRWCEITPEADLIWEDFYAASRRAKLTKRQRLACKLYMELQPIVEIARKMHRDESTIRQHIEVGFKKLDGLGTNGMGTWTCIVEDCGGWDAIHDFIANIN